MSFSGRRDPRSPHRREIGAVAVGYPGTPNLGPFLINRRLFLRTFAHILQLARLYTALPRSA